MFLSPGLHYFLGHQGFRLMPRIGNPFHEQFVTETISPENYVRLFSPKLLEREGSLFLPGNVVLTGVKGSGKSMLLSLLKAKTRIAYERAGQPFPVSRENRQFVGAGINLTRSNFSQFGQRRFPTVAGKNAEGNQLPLYAADFFNYWVVLNLLKSIEHLCSELNGRVGQELGISTDKFQMDVFATTLSKEDCWFGYLDNISGMDELISRINRRLFDYRSFLNFNCEELAADISTTKTTVGAPISIVTRILREMNICPLNTEFYITIDQYEELFQLEGAFKHLGIQGALRGTINRALAARDPNVSYRIGTRAYAWQSSIDLEGTTAKLEVGRNYKLVDIDDLLRRHENTQGWLFPKFAEDVFRRRLEFSGFSVKHGCLVQVYGHAPTSKEKAKGYAGNNPCRVLQLHPTWPAKWTTFLRDLAKQDPLSARFGEAWARQRGKNKSSVMSEVPVKPFPWEKANVWRQERKQLALIQIAGACAQRPKYSGDSEIIGLSASNIWVFLIICSCIWSRWSASAQDLEDFEGILPQIDNESQSVGILEAATRYFDVVEQDGKEGQLFISVIGEYLGHKLYSDRALSYPGHNGFSLAVSDFEQMDEVREMLQALTDRGHLIESPHTTKEKNRQKRRKWYLNPVLTPLFDLPYIRKKEPLYVTGNHVLGWIRKSQTGGKIPFRKEGEEPSLPFDER